jgi:hypothetical protein
MKWVSSVKQTVKDIDLCIDSVYNNDVIKECIVPDLVRTQILLTRPQYESLSRLASREGRSLSELVREAVEAQLRRQRYLELQEAAAALRADYAVYGDLKDMQALDGAESGDAPR